MNEHVDNSSIERKVRPETEIGRVPMELSNRINEIRTVIVF